MKRVLFKRMLREGLPLLSVLIGIVLVSVSVGPFQNGDTQWEYEAASGVIRWGMPYVTIFGNIMDQPPLGFYIEAIFFKVFGLSIGTGIALVTLFGLGCTVLVYIIGKVLYGKSTGLLAVVLFALTQWHLILSRSFLIDVQCLFFSLLSILIGIYALRKNSFKFFILSGFIFAAAFLTKLYAVFALIPLILLYVYYQPRSLRRALHWMGAFFLPTLLLNFLWYQVISGQGILSIFLHQDFINSNYGAVAPSYLFVSNFLLNYGLGWFFTAAAVLSLMVSFLHRSLFPKIAVFDLICLATIACVVGANTLLGAGLNLKSPYLNAIKYDYQSLPFFALLAASLPAKCLSLFYSAKSKGKNSRLLFFFVAIVGFFLIATTILVSIFFANLISRWGYLLFRAEMDKTLGYSLFNPTPIGTNSLLMGIQYLGFAFILYGLFWASRSILLRLFRRLIATFRVSD